MQNFHKRPLSFNEISTYNKQQLFFLCRSVLDRHVAVIDVIYGLTTSHGVKLLFWCLTVVACVDRET